MQITINGSLPKDNDIDGVPAEFLAPPPKCEFVQLDFKSTITKNDAFESRYRTFYADLYHFHEKFHAAECVDDFTKLSIAIGEFGNKYPSDFCQAVIVKVFEEIERVYVEGGKNEQISAL